MVFELGVVKNFMQKLNHKILHEYIVAENLCLVATVSYINKNG